MKAVSSKQAVVECCNKGLGESIGAWDHGAFWRCLRVFPQVLWRGTWHGGRNLSRGSRCIESSGVRHAKQPNLRVCKLAHVEHIVFTLTAAAPQSPKACSWTNVASRCISGPYTATQTTPVGPVKVARVAASLFSHPSRGVAAPKSRSAKLNLTESWKKAYRELPFPFVGRSTDVREIVSTLQRKQDPETPGAGTPLPHRRSLQTCNNMWLTALHVQRTSFKHQTKQRSPQRNRAALFACGCDAWGSLGRSLRGPEARAAGSSFVPQKQRKTVCIYGEAVVRRARWNDRPSCSQRPL